MVQTFPSDRANEALAIRILPRGMRSGEHLVNPHRMGGCRERLAINSVAIAQQVAGRTIPGEGLDELPRRPFCRGMRGYAKVKESAAIMRQNQKNEEQTESRRGNHKEVCRDQFLGMISRKVLQVCEGGLRWQTMYLATVACARWMPSFRSSP